MKCPKCYEENPENAKFCLSCGSPLPLHQMRAKPETGRTEEISDEIFFKGVTIKVSQSLYEYNELYCGIVKRMNRHVETFAHEGKELSTDMFFEQAPSLAGNYIKEVVSYAIRKFVIPKVGFVCDADSLMKDYIDYIGGGFYTTYTECSDDLAGLAEYGEAHEQYLREKQQRANHSWHSWHGVSPGYGLVDAIGSHVQATALNVASGALTGVGNSISRAATSSEIQRQKKKIYEKRNIVASLISELQACGSKIAEVIADICDIRGWETLSDNELQSLFAEGVCNEEESKENRVKYLAECFRSDPYNLKFYRQAGKIFGTSDLEIYMVASYFGQEYWLAREYEDPFGKIVLPKPWNNSYKSFADAYKADVDLLSKMSLIEQSDGDKEWQSLWRTSEYAQRMGVSKRVDILWNAQVAPVEKLLVNDAHNIGLNDFLWTPDFMQDREARLVSLMQGKNGTFVSRCISLMQEQRGYNFFMTLLEGDKGFEERMRDFEYLLRGSELGWLSPKAFLCFDSFDSEVEATRPLLAITIAGLIVIVGDAHDFIRFDEIINIYEERVDVGKAYERYRVAIQYRRAEKDETRSVVYNVTDSMVRSRPHFNVGQMLRESIFAYCDFGETADKIETIHKEREQVERELRTRLENNEKRRAQEDEIQQAEIARIKEEKEEAERKRKEEEERAKREQSEQEERKREEKRKNQEEAERIAAQRDEEIRLAQEKYRKEHPFAYGAKNATAAAAHSAANVAEGVGVLFYLLVHAVPYILGLGVVIAIGYCAVSGIKQGVDESASNSTVSSQAQIGNEDNKSSTVTQQGNSTDAESVQGGVTNTASVSSTTKGTSYWNSQYGFTMYLPDEYNFADCGTWYYSNLDGSDARFMLAVDSQGIEGVNSAVENAVINSGNFAEPKVSQVENDYFICSGYSTSGDYIYYYRGREINDLVVVVAFIYPTALRERYDAQVELVTVSLQALPMESVAMEEIERMPDYTLSEQETRYTTAEYGLVLRAGPGKEYPKIWSIPYSSTVTIIGGANDTSEWAFVSYGELNGWVSTEYLSTSSQ